MCWMMAVRLVFSSLLLLSLLILKDTIPVRKKHTTIKVDGLKRRVDLVFISDLHGRRLREHHLPAGRVDAVLVGGDIQDKRCPLRNVKENVHQMRRIGSVFAVFGNHDYPSEAELRNVYEENGAHLLDNEAVDMDSWILAGAGDSTSNRDHLSVLCTSHPTVLLTHNPDLINRMKQRDDFCLMLSGHTHGGQIRFGPFGIAEKGKVTRRKGLPLIISNGFGTTGVPVRFGAPPEIHRITLVPMGP
ncbi:metallophosphoesterase [Alkalicoccus urumqiensis]|uniref:Metallophosphoesterase n=1 Tax=Alkalicoccus urumqiensis TaxID=1548213 RepID=A0A2P6MKH2_ALKUR|nr:metallophosphoesterase [Alkalicoccus urumqiensis]PRO66787.1 metallophosphoesterase [Alkalicoccus urumqiensis]